MEAPFKLSGFLSRTVHPGATAQAVTRMVLSQLLRHVGVGILVGASLAAGTAILLLSLPDAALIADVVHVFDPLAYGASLLFIVMSCAAAAWIPARRAALIDPIATLRED